MVQQEQVEQHKVVIQYFHHLQHKVVVHQEHLVEQVLLVEVVLVVVNGQQVHILVELVFQDKEMTVVLVEVVHEQVVVEEDLLVLVETVHQRQVEMQVLVLIMIF